MQKIKIALVGQPNVGKTSLINNLSGAHLKVGNFTGVTVEKAQASLIYKDTQFVIIDLPGTYGLNDYTLEEKITKDFLHSQDYDIILNVVDSTNLERNLVLSAEVLALQKKTIIALNMFDEAQKESIQINHQLLSEILGVNCIPTTAITNQNHHLLDKILEVFHQSFTPAKRFYSDVIEQEIRHIQDFMHQRQYPEIQQFIQEENPNYSFRDIAILLLSQDKNIYAFLHDKPSNFEINTEVQKSLSKLYKLTQEKNTSNIFKHDAISFARGASKECIKYENKQFLHTKKLDSIFLNKYLGIPIFLFFMFVLFELTFFVGGALKDFLEGSMAVAGSWIKTAIPNADIASLIGDGIIGGVGSVISFLPLIMILYLGISLLEGTGYMARVAFLLDGIFHKFGLHGKSFIPLVTGFGCSVPAYMATRTLQNKNERMITLFLIGFMSCSARLPIYVLFIGAFFPNKYAGLVLFGVYIFGAIMALFLAKFLKLTIFSGNNEPFVMEMPKYRLPSYKVVWFSIWMKVVMYLKKAGTFILLGAILIWFASQYPKNPQVQSEYQQSIHQVEISQIPQEEKEKMILDLENERDEILLQQSYSGKIGVFLKPIFSPMNFDWRLSVSLVTGFAAKEVVVSTLGVLYSLGDSQDESSEDLQTAIRNSISMPTAIAFLTFIVFYMPCFAATITFGRETGGIKFVIGLFAFTTIVAYLLAYISFHIASFFSTLLV
ncbi:MULTISPECIES: ferrous iron transport protein B [unclassified Helicobacter]|uniref:ferrous iron transport protein B n=1 Tax=unclassified Helicobacter TaxID=2593540 RepID=UPI000CF109DE|nr:MULTISPECIES: ferrous iron transport protein B [unclassified Helicobacter]